MEEAAFKRGLEAIRARRYFEAHEELEEAWRAAAAEERDFFQGLVHVAVAWYQAGRGRPVATGSQLEKAARRLGPFAPVHRGVDVDAVLTQVDAARARVAEGSLDLDPPRLP
ncbi:MAG TPA: DUF309 domain-containing protein [Gaiellaceae bacterium]|nr:DUF309 domain-containing protein [Gaiellaceae bacterium]